ncbi:MAG TPA: DNA polymerase III, partial [Terriglobales bacterium]|nr:DNA polymerase III [Terriglobales bacterium]
PSGRLLLRREPYAFEFEQVLAACRRHGVVMEINASPERLDMNAVQARRCRQQGVKVVINTDAHHPRHFDNLRHGIATARRGWLEAADVLNTRPADQFLAALRRA